MDIVIAITGASGSVYGVRLLEVFKERNVRTHLLVSKVAEEVLVKEMNMEPASLRDHATYFYDTNDLFARICSGSYRTDGMVVVPCSMKTLAAIAQGFSNNVITRAADVMLKEKRPLVIVPRETPLNAIQLENMLKLARNGAVILPAMPAFYHDPKTISDQVDFIVGKILDSLNIEQDLYKPWMGVK
jgi:4-hydroxy-3-polyprenylbenzoate decarboxylase